jgi:hypothetical protein
MKMALRIIVGFLLAILFCAARLPAQTGALTGYCTLGGTKASTSGLPSINYLQGVVPDCTVTVYLTGTTTKATLYSDLHNTPLTNPFTAVVTSGQWLFYASTARAYDIVMSGGITPNVYTVPVTLTSVGIPSPSSTINPIGPPYNCKIDGVTDDTACWQAVCAAAQLINGVVLMPAGTSLLTQGVCTISRPMGFLGAGVGQSILSFTGSAAIPSAFDIENTTNVNLGGFGITGATGSATGLVTALKIVNAQHVSIHDMNISGGGYGNSGVNPRAQLYMEHDDDVTLNYLHFTNSGGLYTIVNGYNGKLSTRIHERNIIDDNNLAEISISNFNMQLSDTIGVTIDQNNSTGVADVGASGYGVLYYASGVSIPLSSGCTGSDTITCTIPLLAGITRLPYPTHFVVETQGVTGGTGTLNGTWDATLLSPTTFSFVSTGANSAGADFSASVIFFPNTLNTIDQINVRNTAGSCIYLQGINYTSINNWHCQNVDQQQPATSLPAGCISINAGGSLEPFAEGDVVGAGTCNGTGQYGIDFANTKNLRVTGPITINNAAIAGVRAFAGSDGNFNFDLSGVTVDNSPVVFRSQPSVVNQGTVSITGSNFTTAGLFPLGSGINFRDSTLNASAYYPCVDDFYGNNNYDNVVCNGGYFLLAGTSPSVITNGGVFNVTAGVHNHAVNIIGAQHLTLSNFTISTAPDGIFLTNNSALQPTDIAIKNTHLYGISGALIWDQLPTSVTLTTNTSTTVTITTATPVLVGMGLGDYGTGGNNDIPQGTTITAVTPPCNAGCTATISNAATGSHTNEAGLLQQVMESGVKIWDADAQCAPATTTQAFLFYGMQNLELARNSISECVGQGDIDLRGQTGQLGKVTISGGTINQSSGLASVRIPGALLGSAANVMVQGVVSTGTGTNDFYDHGTGTGNVFNLLTGSTSQTPAVNVSNVNTTLKGQFTVSLTPGAVAASACAEQTFNLSPGSGQIVQAGQTITVTPPGAMTHVSIGYARGTSGDHLVVQFCGDSTGGTPPAGTYTVSAL